MIKKFWYIVAVLLLATVSWVQADNLDLSDGMSHNGVTAIVEDERGYLWVGTYDGLNIYDGDTFTVIRNNADTTILRDNRVRSLYEAAEGQMWIGSDRGISIYDYMHNTMRSVTCGVGLFQNEDVIRRIVANRSGDVVALIENGGVATFDKAGVLKQYRKLPGLMLNDICEISRGRYLVSSNNGVYLYNAASQGYRRVLGGDNDIYEKIIVIDENRYAIAAASGVAIVNVTFDNERVVVAQEGANRFGGHRIKTLHKDQLGNLWIGANFHGVSVVENFEQEDEAYMVIDDSYNLRISCFCEGANSRLWIGSFNRGILKHSLKRNLFKSITLGKSIGESYRTGRLFKLDDQYLAIKTDKSNYQKYNTSTAEVSELLPATLNRAGTVAAASHDGSLWVLSGFGKAKDLYKVSGGRGYRCDIERSSDNLPHGIPKSMLEDAFGNLWLVYNKSVFRISMRGEGNKWRIEEIALGVSYDRVLNTRSMYVDPKDNSLWIPSASVGLYHVTNPDADRDQLTIKGYQHVSSDKFSLPSNLASSVVRATDGSLWVGTEQGGLCRVIEPEMRFEQLTPSYGVIANRNVKSLLCDSRNRLWIATNIGVSLYDIASDKVVNYGSHDGIPSEVMTFYSVALSDDLFVFAGSEQSFIVDATIEMERDIIPQFHFGNLTLYSNVVEVGEKVKGRVLYDSRLKSGDVVKLNYDQNVFSIEIDALHYADHNNHSFRYRLLPQNTEWITRSTSQGIVAFNGLQSGDYELVVEVSNASGEWSSPKSLSILIYPPFWKTWWAYLLYTLLVVVSIWVVINVLLKIEEYKHSMQVEAIERYNMAEKQRYFSNIAHEIKTPLALIVAPVEALLETFSHDRAVKEKLQRITVQSRKMTHLIDVAQSIQLSDAGLLKVQSSVFNFSDFMQSIIGDFKILAGHDKKVLDVASPAVDVIVDGDISMLEKIANNLINNAMKYTLQGDSISVSWAAEGDDLVLRVSDSGIGISQDDLPHIFERFYRGANLSTQAPSGTGIGLSFSMRLAKLHGGSITVESQKGEGSTFIVTLPIITDQEPSTLTVIEQSSSPDNYLYDDFDSLNAIEQSQYRDSLIYVVEDNSEMRLMVERIVGRFYNVVSFANGEEAIAAIDKRWPDLILSDVMMPVMDGYELCERIKSDIRTSHIPVILLTAFGSNDEKIKGKELGADLYLEKPFYPKYLIACIENTLRGRAQLRDRFKSGIPTSFSDDRQNSRDNKFLEQFYALVSENIATEELDLDKIARELGVNRTHFYQKIKNLTGQTPFDLIKEVRLVRSAELLVEGDMTIEEICVNTGFKSRTHFSKLFKDKFGVTPGRYAASIKK